jgi:hypothetical protein
MQQPKQGILVASLAENNLAGAEASALKICLPFRRVNKNSPMERRRQQSFLETILKAD